MMSRCGGVLIRVGCAVCGLQWWITQDSIVRDRSDRAKVLTRDPELIDAPLLWNAREYVGDWEGSQLPRDMGGDLRKDWLDHMKSDTHAMAKGRIQHLPTAMGYLQGDDVRQHMAVRDIGPMPVPMPGFVLPRTVCQGASLPTRETLGDTCGTGVLLSGFLLHLINEERVGLAFSEQGSYQKRTLTVNIKDVETVSWGGILWAARNINQQYREADYAVYLSYQDTFATDLEWWYMTLGTSPSPLVAELPRWVMEYMTYELVDDGSRLSRSTRK